MCRLRVCTIARQATTGLAFGFVGRGLGNGRASARLWPDGRRCLVWTGSIIKGPGFDLEAMRPSRRLRGLLVISRSRRTPRSLEDLGGPRGRGAPTHVIAQHLAAKPRRRWLSHRVEAPPGGLYGP